MERGIKMNIPYHILLWKGISQKLQPDVNKYRLFCQILELI